MPLSLTFFVFFPKLAMDEINPPPFPLSNLPSYFPESLLIYAFVMRTHTPGNRVGVWAVHVWLETLPPCYTCCPEKKQRQTWPTLALITWKAGHFHCLLAQCVSRRGLLKWSTPESKEAVGSFSSPGQVTRQQSCQQGPVWGCEQRPRGTDSKRCLELDSNLRQAKPPTFMIILGGKRGS